MRRADRLFQIIQLIRKHRVTTAAVLAESLEVSERTVYRDIRDLVLSGVPIEGEAGVGYVLRKGFDLPPLMFTRTEIEALVLGMRVVSSWGDPELAKAAESAMDRISVALPDALRDRLTSSRLYAPGYMIDSAVIERLGQLRGAVDDRWRVWMAYRDAADAETRRTVRPLGLAFFGNRWMLLGWCELREGFRAFRLDRVVEMEVFRERFDNEPGKTIDDYMALMREEES